MGDGVEGVWGEWGYMGAEAGYRTDVGRLESS